jgi:tyrosinase
MAVIRKNILKDAAARDKYIKGVTSLKLEPSGKTTTDFGIPGAAKSVSTYDLFVIWHSRAMMTSTPPPPQPNPGGRNAAHRGSVFLPWHRVMLLALEQNLKRILGDNTFGLPYWDWAADGDLPPAQQKQSPFWATNCMGGDGKPVKTGPFTFRPADPKCWRVRIEGNSAAQLKSVNRGLWRGFADPQNGVPNLPTSAQVSSCVQLTPYDTANWDTGSDKFRNTLEGWRSSRGQPEHHNRVHVWVGGDMWPSTSPNDPVFYLNHCNADRLWEAWLRKHGRAYLPDMTASANLKGHRIDDQLVSPAGANATPREVLDVGTIYNYDVLP